ncbi:MAG: CapA family protein [Anaerolineaceae bacterium]
MPLLTPKNLAAMACATGFMLTFLSACQTGISASSLNPADPKPTLIETSPAAEPAEVIETAAPVADQTPLKYYASPAIPFVLAEAVKIQPPFEKATSAKKADLQFIPITADALENVVITTRWVYSLVAPFPTITDTISSDDIRKAWQGKKTVQFPDSPLLVSPETREVLAAIWGPPAGDRVKVLPADQILTDAWDKQPAWALIPFEDINPRWKVLAVDGLSPLEKNFDLDAYALTVDFGFTSKQEIHSNMLQNQSEWATVPASNRDENKLTTLVMTGTTALARATAERMETMGVTYPAEKILPWLRDADLTHISNEIPFSEDCPPAVPVRTDWNFCSDPSYVQLLKYIGADIIELTGNHVMDWGAGDFLYTLSLYKEGDFKVYGGGRDLDEARQALLVEDHGNRLAFLGCNQPGPEYAWASDESPGNAPCDREWMASEVTRLTELGYLVIVTFQHIEVYDYLPVPPQRGDFQAMAEAGAVIVSGSQSHFPQGMAFYGQQFLHYGLGNLFFDQMDEPVIGTRREFIDRHIFYDGHYIGTQLLTAMLEDHAQPRPMTAEERKALLRDGFKASTW